MANRSITLRTQGGPQSITSINCGSSTPRLGGSIDLSQFSALTSFVCNSNDIVEILGYENNSNLQTISFENNKITIQFQTKWSPPSEEIKAIAKKYKNGIPLREMVVLSRKNSSDQFKGFTWDVEYLKENGWKIIVNTPEEVLELVICHLTLSAEPLGKIPLVPSVLTLFIIIPSEMVFS